MAQIRVATGACGAGKTATVRALEERCIPGVGCFAVPRAVHVALLDCSPPQRNSRLRTSREQPELANVTMDPWAAYLRGQADALKLKVIDTTALTISQAADQLEFYALSLIGNEHD